MSGVAITAGFEHVHRVYRSDAELADVVVADVRAALADDDAVLVCLPGDQWAAIAARLDHLAGEVTYMPAGDRYARPIDAMSALWDFAEEAISAGHARAHSLGAIGFTGTEADTPWLRYEVAVNEVFRELPLRAVCLVNGVTTPPHLLDHLEQVHDHGPVRGARCDEVLEAQRRLVRHLPPAVRIPPQPAEVVTSGSTRDARRALTAALDGRVPVDALDDIQLVVTELLANAQRHGGADPLVRLWLVDGHAVVAVTDGGTGPRQASAGLRPAQLTPGGRGLWIVHQLCAAVDLVVADGRHAVLATYSLPH